MRRGDVHLIDEILLARGRADDALAAAPLRAVGILRQALDIAAVRQRDDHVLLVDQVEHVDFAVHGRDLGAALVGVLAADLADLVADDAEHELLIGQHASVVGNLLLQLGVLGFELVALQSGQALEAHIQYGLSLAFGQAEARHQSIAGILWRAAAADQRDDLVDVIERDEQAFQNVAARLCLVQIVLRAPADDILLVLDVVVDHLLERKHLGHAVHQGEHDRTERVLHLRVLVQRIQHDVRIRVPLQLDDDAHALAVGLIADV